MNNFPINFTIFIHDINLKIRRWTFDLFIKIPEEFLKIFLDCIVSNCKTTRKLVV